MLICAADSLDHLDVLLDSKADALVFGLQDVSVRTNAILASEQLFDYAALVHQSGKRLYVNFLGLLEQSRLDLARKRLAEAVSCGVDGIYIADEGYIEMARVLEKTLGCPVVSLLVYQPETLICSGQDADFYRSQGLQASSLSHELAVDEIEECARICPDCEMLIAGEYSWMESRRPLVSNYLQHIGQSEDFQPGRIYRIRELQRDGWLYLWQDAWGSHVLSPQPLQAGEDIYLLAKAGISRFRIDGLGQGNAWAAEMVELYSEALRGNKIELPQSNLPQARTQIRKETEHAN